MVKKVHRSIILGGTKQYDWLRNEFFTDQGLHHIQDFFNGEIKAWTNKMAWLFNIATFFDRRVLRRSSFLCNLKPLDKELGLIRTPTWAPFIFLLKKIILSTIPIVASSNLVLGWNFWPTGALLCHSLNRPLHKTYKSAIGWRPKWGHTIHRSWYLISLIIQIFVMLLIFLLWMWDSTK